LSPQDELSLPPQVSSDFYFYFIYYKLNINNTPIAHLIKPVNSQMYMYMYMHM